MSAIYRYLTAGAIIAASTLSVTVANADDGDFGGHRNAYAVTPLVSDIGGDAAVLDPVLQNAWGVAFSPAGSPFWGGDDRGHRRAARGVLDEALGISST
jgi:hypothetical protein